MTGLNNYLLSFITFSPLVGAIMVAFCRSVSAAKLLALATSAVTFLATLHLWYYFDGSEAGLQFVEAYEWLPAFGVKIIVGVDGLSLLLVVLTAFLTPLIIISQWQSKVENLKVFLCLFLVLETGMLGALLAIDLVYFYVFWEAMLIPMYLLIGIWGGKNRIYATTKFLIYTVVGSLFMLIAAIALYWLHKEQFGVYSTSLIDLYRVTVPAGMQTWMFLAFALSFAIKVPMWPFHTWLPDAHVEAPTAGSVILAGVLLKMGTYGLLRFAVPLFPAATAQFAPLLIALGVIGIIYGALTAWAQQDAKKLVAYSSVSHLGFVVVGSFAVLASGTAISTEALAGAVYQMINHGITTPSLFFLVGVIYERRHTRLLEDYGGLAAVMPWFAVMLIIATLGSVGLPGTGGFVGEFLILLGLFQAKPAAAILASTGVLLGAVYMLHLCRKILFGPITKEENRKLKDLAPHEFAYLVPLAVLTIAMGIYPSFFLDKAKPSIDYLAKNFGSYRLQIASQEGVAAKGPWRSTVVAGAKEESE